MCPEHFLTDSSIINDNKHLWASLTKQSRSVRECNSKTAPVGEDISAGD